MRYVLGPKIQCDLEEIADWIARDNPDRAVRFLHEFRVELVRIAANPMIYRLRPDIGVDARLAVIGSYVALFRISEDVVRFERIVHGRRDLPRLYR